MQLKIEMRLIDDEKYGPYIRYIPVLDSTGECCFDGQIRFAHWEVSVGEPPEAHAEAKSKAKQNAAQVLARIASELSAA